MISVSRALSWWMSALGFWRRAPIQIALACLLPLLAEVITQLIPLVGIPASKVIEPLVVNGLFAVFEKLRTSERFEWREVLWSFRAGNRVPAFQLALISVGIYVLQLAVATAVYGLPALDAGVLGHITEHRELLNRQFPLVLILPGMVPATLVLFVGPLVVAGGKRPIEALKSSLGVFASSPGAFVVTCAIIIALMAVVLWWPIAILLLLVLLPMLTLLGYVGYRDVFADGGSRQY